MPTMDVLERDYERAIEIVKRDYPDVQEGSPLFWSLVFGVVKRMRGRKSARHLDYMRILEKAEIFDSLFYLPYMFSQKVSGVDLLMDLPELPAKVPPSALPSFPAFISKYVDLMRQFAARKNLTPQDFANEVVNHILNKPLMVALDNEKFRKLVRGSAPLESVEREGITSDEEIGWKLLWVYAMLTKKIQPLTPRWGYKLAQLTRDVRDIGIKRLVEHFAEVPLPNPFRVYKQVHTFDLSLYNLVVLNGRALTDTVKVMVAEVKWKRGTVEDYWYLVRRALGCIFPAWVAYALDYMGELDIKDAKFLFREALSKDEVLCAFVDEELLEESAPFPVEVKPVGRKELVGRVKMLARDDSSFKNLRDEIASTISKKWI